MKKRLRRGLSLLLSAALAMSMNVTAFAEEIQFEAFETAGAEAEEEIDEARVTEAMLLSENGVTGVTPVTPETPEYIISADEVLSENAVAISNNLAAKAIAEGIKGTTNTFFVVHPNAIAFDGKNKPSSKSVLVQVFYAPNSASVSAGDLDDELDGNNLTGYSVSSGSVFKEAGIKKFKIKAAKGATVELDGDPLYTVNKSTFISGIKLSDKTLDKELSKLLKAELKATKKDKSNKVSANGLIDGKDVAVADYVIPVYPAYIGNDETGEKVADEIGLVTVAPNFSKTKLKNGVPNKVLTSAGGKKVTLKPTKKAGKYKGFVNTVNTCEAGTNSLKATKYLVADGNFAGNIYFTIS